MFSAAPDTIEFDLAYPLLAGGSSTHVLLHQAEVRKGRGKVALCIVIVYDRVSEIMAVKDARKQLFTQNSHALENTPLIQVALEQHIIHANFQANSWNKSIPSFRIYRSMAG